MKGLFVLASQGFAKCFFKLPLTRCIQYHLWLLMCIGSGGLSFSKWGRETCSYIFLGCESLEWPGCGLTGLGRGRANRELLAGESTWSGRGRSPAQDLAMLGWCALQRLDAVFQHGHSKPKPWSWHLWFGSSSWKEGLDFSCLGFF